MLRVPLQKFLRCPAILTCIAALAALAALAACATKPLAAGTRCVISVPKSSFYKYGPAQTSGPDFTLTQGTKVTLLQSSFGFSRVMTDDGIGGYVASNGLAPTSPEPPPGAGKPSGGGSRSVLFSSGPKRSNVRPTPGSPLFDTNDPPLPLPENSPPPKPAPGFRF
jgi:hypothetical protein